MQNGPITRGLCAGVAVHGLPQPQCDVINRAERQLSFSLTCEIDHFTWNMQFGMSWIHDNYLVDGRDTRVNMNIIMVFVANG